MEIVTWYAWLKDTKQPAINSSLSVFEVGFSVDAEIFFQIERIFSRENEILGHL